jgi:hypothetical protein
MRQIGKDVGALARLTFDFKSMEELEELSKIPSSDNLDPRHFSMDDFTEQQIAKEREERKKEGKSLVIVPSDHEIH